MTEQTQAAASAAAPAEPMLNKKPFDPKGVMQRHSKPIVYGGFCLLVVVALLFSSRGKTAVSAKQQQKQNNPQPFVQDNTENNVADFRNQLAHQQETADQATVSDPSTANVTPQQRAAILGYSASGQAQPCIPGQPCSQQMQGYGYAQQNGRGAGQVSPEQQASQELAARERQRAYESRFSSNLAYTRPPDAPPQTQATNAGNGTYLPTSMASGQQPSSLVSARAAGDPPAAQSQSAFNRKPEINIDSATGQPYVLYEGTTIDTVLMNRLDGDAVGPVKVLVSNPVYSHDHQHVLIPDGTIVLGEARKIGGSGFGQQRRMAVAFHRLIMPDGYSVDLDQFHGLDQIGEEGLKDKVNNHYLQIFGTSIALGVIAGAAEVSQGGGVYAGSGPQVFTNGAAASVSQSATTVLDRFMQIPPTITVREGHRVKVYITQDLLLPAYEHHTIPGSF
ncbi:TrbI/VirB10 family protein [Terriglobus albidus]|uniref:TrbI/VirB10 family protein n=1 Tax=Terriglobus albidus TaxID=1592106 RepID=UPI0021E0CC24|nr:TrbI/VirB10 family protein [Terriglobus albidus]